MRSDVDRTLAHRLDATIDEIDIERDNVIFVMAADAANRALCAPKLQRPVAGEGLMPIV